MARRLNTPKRQAYSSVVVQLGEDELAEQWEAYDDLPPAMRRLLQDAPVDVDATEALYALEMFGEIMAVALYEQSFQDWSRHYRASFDAEVP